MADDQKQNSQTTGAQSATAAAAAVVPAAVAPQGGGKKPPADESQFEIPQTVRDRFPHLIPLILQTESMTNDERQYWFQILPIMTDEQVKKLEEILVNEKQQLEKLDQEYQEEIKHINAKHNSQWKEFEEKEKRRKLRETESKSEQEEKAHEEELLKKLGNV